MSLFAVISCGFVVFGIGFGLSAVLANATFLADVPNARSSHHHVTSRGGGIAVLAGWFVGLLAAGVAGLIPGGLMPAWPDAARVFVMVVLVLLAGLGGVLDDRYAMSPLFKFSVQLILAVFFVLGVGVIETVPVPFVGFVMIGWLGFPLTVFWIVAVMNVVNFMDGINGIAGACTALTLLVIAVLAAAMGQPLIMIPALLLSWAIVSFLPQNLLAGNLFMGDGGSQAIGFAIAGFAVLLDGGTGLPVQTSIVTVPIILSPFIADVAFTLVHRANRSKKLTEAHREHIYQILTRSGWSHAETVGWYLGAVTLAGAVALVSTHLGATGQWGIVLVVFAVEFLVLHLVFSRFATIAGLFEHNTLDQKTSQYPTQVSSPPLDHAAE